MKTRTLFRFASLWLAPGLAVLPARAQIGGQTGGSTAAGVGIDDFNVSMTMGVSYQTNVPSMIGAINLAGFNGASYMFAGVGPAVLIPNIPASDFSIFLYQPWVVNDNAGQNGFIGPDGTNYNRGITGQDAGGANFFLTYTPSLASDPTSINFIQTISQDDNGMGFGPAFLDNFRSTTSPYYNQGGHAAGVGMIKGVSPLNIPPGGFAWFIDVPYACENGTAAQRHDGANCSGGADETILSQTRIFETFVEADMTIGGVAYNVLMGGVQWGYTYTNADIPTPEPSSILLLATGLIGVWGYRRPFNPPHRYSRGRCPLQPASRRSFRALQ